MFGCCSDARICRSSRKRARRSSVSRPRRSSLSAACMEKTPSERSARYTVPMPPRPSSSLRRQGPTSAGTALVGTLAGASRKEPACASARSSERTSASSAASVPQASAR